MIYINEEGQVFNKGDRIVVNGEVYGGTDYDNPEKFAEMNLKPLKEINKEYDPKYYEIDSFTDIEIAGVITRTYTIKESKSIENLKEAAKEAIKDKLKMNLTLTNQDILDCFELGTKIPLALRTERDGYRQLYNNEILLVENTNDYAKLVDLIKTNFNNLTKGEKL